MNTDRDDVCSDIIDLSGIDFARLDALPDSVFATALRRLRHENDSSIIHYAGFESFLSPTPSETEITDPNSR